MRVTAEPLGLAPFVCEPVRAPTARLRDWLQRRELNADEAEKADEADKTSNVSAAVSASSASSV